MKQDKRVFFFLRHFIFKSIMSVTCEEASVRLSFFFFSVSVEIKNAETNEDAAGVWLEVVSLFFFPSPYCVCGVVFFSVADIIKLRMVQVVVENKKKKKETIVK